MVIVPYRRPEWIVRVHLAIFRQNEIRLKSFFLSSVLNVWLLLIFVSPRAAQTKP